MNSRPKEHLWDYLSQCISHHPQMNILRELATTGVECHPPDHYLQTYRVDEKTLHGLCCHTWWSYALLTFHCDPTCLSCVHEFKLINDCSSFFHLMSLLIIHLLLFTTKTFIAQVFFSKSKYFSMVHIQCSSV